MVQELHGKTIWLPNGTFQDDILPKPPACVMLTDEEIDTFRTALKEMLDNHKGRAKRAYKNEEEQLSLEFVRVPQIFLACSGSTTNDHQTTLVNKHVLTPVAGKSTKPESCSPTSPEASADDQPADTPPSDTTNHRPRYPVTLVDTVPSYVMRLSLYKADKNDIGLNKADSAIFLVDPAVKLEEGRPNWAHQRLFCEFKTAGIENDPFEDALGKAVEPQAESRVKVRGQLIAYADRLFAYQHRMTAFSLIVLGGEFRFLCWDRSGLFVTEKVDYVAQTRILMELLLGFAVLSPASQSRYRWHGNPAP